MVNRLTTQAAASQTSGSSFFYGSLYATCPRLSRPGAQAERAFPEREWVRSRLVRKCLQDMSHSGPILATCAPCRTARRPPQSTASAPSPGDSQQVCTSPPNMIAVMMRVACTLSVTSRPGKMASMPAASAVVSPAVTLPLVRSTTVGSDVALVAAGTVGPTFVTCPDEGSASEADEKTGQLRVTLSPQRTHAHVRGDGLQNVHWIRYLADRAAAGTSARRPSY